MTARALRRISFWMGIAAAACTKLMCWLPVLLAGLGYGVLVIIED